MNFDFVARSVAARGVQFGISILSLSYVTTFYNRIRGLLYCSIDTLREIILRFAWGMKPGILLSSLALCCFLSLCMPNDPAWAASISYPTDSVDSDNDFTPTKDVDLTGNTVTVNSGGAAINGNVSGGWSTGGDTVSGNAVTVNGGTVSWDVYGGVSNTGNASGNSVTLNGGDVGLNVFGGLAAFGTGFANGNTVTVNSSYTGTLNTIYGGSTGGGDALGNRVIFDGSSSASAAFGVYGGFVGGPGTGIGNANNNTVEIRGGTVNGMVAGGSVSGTGSAIGNIVTITGANPLNLSGATLLGGEDFGGSGDDVRSGNTLNLHRQTTVDNLLNFEKYNFYLPSTLAAGQTMLRVSNTADLGTNANVNVGIAGGSSPLQQGNQVVLIDAGTLTGSLAKTTADGQGMQGVTLRYTFDLLMDNNQLLAMVTSVGSNPQLKALSEGRVAGHAFLNQGSDLIVGQGIYSLLAAPRYDGETGLIPFAAGQGGWSRYDTGSHVDVSGASMLAGLGWRQPVQGGEAGSFLLGLFFEAGWGGYDSYNSFSNYASVDGDGDISYYGGGVLGRYDFAPMGPGNLYVDASFRVGRVSTDFNSSDLRDFAGNDADYDSAAAYYGAHAGLGYLWNINEQASLDFSTRYLWTNQNSDSVKVAGDRIDFDAIDSQRWRTGARFTYQINEYVAPYAGAYFDYEFDGEADASAYGYGIDAPDLSGGTGVGELGLSLRPAPDSGFALDLGVQGYMGVREGVSGSLLLKYEF